MTNTKLRKLIRFNRFALLPTLACNFLFTKTKMHVAFRHSGLLLAFIVLNHLLSLGQPNNLGQNSTLPASLNLGLVVHYPMNGNANDQSGNNINGTIVGGVSAATDRFGNSNASLQFNGTNGHITLPSGVYFNGGEFSISAWVRKTANNNWSRLIDFGNGQANNNVVLAITNGTTGRPLGELFNGSTSLGQVGSASVVLSLNQWELLTYTWAANLGRIYINGNLVAQATQTAPPGITRTLNYIGRSNWNSDAYANGRFDDLRIYNRQLTDAEITALVLEQPNTLTASVSQSPLCPASSAQITLSNTQLGVTYQLVNATTLANVGTAQSGNGESLVFNTGTLTSTTSYFFRATFTANNSITNTSPSITVEVSTPPSAPETIGATICNSGNVTLSATGAANDGFYNWYTSPTGGSPLTGANGSSFTTPILTVSTTYYVSITDLNGCEGPRSAVTATVINPLNPPVDILSGLILHYKFDGSLEDSSGNGYNATAFGANSYVNDRNSNPQSAINTTATGSPGGNYLTAGNPAMVQQLTNQVTISMWIRQTQTWFGQTGNDGQMPLINKWNGSTGMWVGLRMTNPANMQNRVRWRVNGTTFIESNTNVPVGTWHHIVCTYNGAQLLIYQNGVLTGTLNHNGAIANTAVELMLARQSNGTPSGGITYRGDYDEVKIYSRALNLSEIQTLFNNESVAFVSTPFCDGQGNLSLSTFNFPGATYAWTGPNGFISNQQNPAIILNADSATYAGTYNLQVSAQGCTSPMQSVNAVIYAFPLAPSVVGDTVCGSGNATLTASGATAGASYRWYTDAVGGTPISGQTSATLTLTNVTSTIVRYVSIIKNGCEGPRSAVSAIFYNPVATNLTLSGSTVCSGLTEASILINASEPGVNYQAFLGSVPISSIALGGGNILLNLSTASMNSGNNTISVSANYPGCGTVLLANTANVLVQNPPSVNITASGPLNFCEGSSVNLTANSAAAYLWSTGETTQSISVANSGNYTVTITGANGCNNTSTAVSISVNDNPVPVITATGPTTFCSGGSVTLSASGGNSYLWSNGFAGNSLSATQSGTYSFTAFNGNCSAVSSNIAVTVLASPNVIANATQTTVCAGQPLTLAGSGAVSYSWSNGVVNGVPFIPVSSGIYTVTGIDANNCSATDVISITVTPLPNAGFTSSPAVFCPGVSSLSLSANSISNANYNWYLNENPLQLNGNASITITQPGNYELITTSNNGCVNSSSLTIGTAPAPSVTISTPNTSFCSGSSAIITATTEPGATYTWYSGTTIVAGPGLGNSTYQATGTGDYSVVVTNSNGCTGSSNVLSIASIPGPPATISTASAIICAGQSALLEANMLDEATYQWLLNGNPINGATANQYLASSGGNYQVLISSGCSSTSNIISITTTPLPAAAGVISGGSSFCAGQSGIFSIASSANASSYSWVISPSSAASISQGQGTNSVVVNTTDQNFTISVTPQNACGVGSASNKPISVTSQFPCSGEIMFAANNTGVCIGNQVVFTNYTSNNLFLGLTPLWNFGAGATPATAVGNGPHTVIYNTAGTKTVTLDYVDAFNNSFANETKTNYIHVTSAVNTGAIVGPASISCASNLEVYSVINNTSSNYQWTVPVGATILSGQGTHSVNIDFNGNPGIISVTETNVNGCTGLPVNLVVSFFNAVNTSGIAGPNVVLCSSTGETYSVQNTTGSTYSWSVPPGATIVNGQGTSNLSVNFNGNFGSVTVVETNAAGCMGTTQQLVVSCITSVNSETGYVPKVFPNPCSDYFAIDMLQSATKALLTLRDSGGKMALELLLANPARIDVSDLENGLYMGTVQLDDQLFQFKLMISK